MRARRAIAVAILLWTSLAVTTVTATAQQAPHHLLESQVNLAVAPISAPVQPLGGIGLATVHATYTYVGAPSISPTRIHLMLTDKPTWVVAAVTPSVVQVMPTCLQGLQCKATVRAELLVHTLADAPAFTPGEIVLALHAFPNGLVAGSSAEERVVVVAGYFGLTQVLAPDVVVVPRGGGATQSLTVTNFGNSDTKVHFELAEVPEGVRVSVPNSVVLESLQKGGKTTQMELPFRVETSPASPGGRVTFLVSTAYALDETILGDSHQISFNVEPGGASDAGSAVVAAASFATAGPQGGTTLVLALVGAVVGLALAWRKVAQR